MKLKYWASAIAVLGAGIGAAQAQVRRASWVHGMFSGKDKKALILGRTRICPPQPASLRDIYLSLSRPIPAIRSLQ